MPMIFYPQEGDFETSPLTERLELLMEAAERFKAAILDASAKSTGDIKNKQTPRDISHAYNWEALAEVLRDIRDLPEANQTNKQVKADRLNKLAEIYEVLRGAKMPKLEAVRLALINEVNHLGAGNSTQVA